MRADAIGSHGRTGLVDAMSISTSGRLSKLVAFGAFIRDSIYAFLEGYRSVKIFRAITKMDRVFTGTTEM